MSSEQERYSLDEMMDRLKTRTSDPSDQGELVTREDGTQAIRVRKRKRRSHQPGKADREGSMRARLLQLSAALCLLFLALLVTGAALVYSNSAPYREKLENNITAGTGATSALSQFRMNPTGSHAASATLRWPEGNVLEQLECGGLRASSHPLSFTGTTFTGDEISALEGKLLLRIPSESATKRSAASPGGNPKGIDFKRYSIRKFTVQFGQTVGPDAPRLTNAEASFYAVHSSGRPQITLARGDVYLPQFPPFKLFRGHLEFPGSEVDVVQLVLQNESNREGSLTLSGRISPYADSSNPLSVKLEQFRIEHLLGAHLGQMFNGTIDTYESTRSNFLTFARDSDGSLAPSFAATFSNTVDTPFVIRGFPFLLSIRQMVEDPWFEAPVFESLAKAELRVHGRETEFRNMNFGARGRMQIRGGMEVTGSGAISGDLHVGLADPIIGASPNADLLERMFGPEKDEYRWITIKLGGTMTAPSDSFRKQADDARASLAAGSPPPPSRNERPAPSGPSFEDLTTPGR